MIEASNFIEEFINEDLAEGKYTSVHTPFPARAERISAHRSLQGAGHRFRNREEIRRAVHLRMDDTNPAKEDTEYVDAIKEDIHWLGFDWGDASSTARTTLTRITNTPSSSSKKDSLMSAS